MKAFFEKIYPDNKLQLKSGEYLENIIAENIELLPHNHMAFFGIIDLEDNYIKQMLEPTVVEELKSKVPPLPGLDPDSSFTKALASFENCK